MRLLKILKKSCSTVMNCAYWTEIGNKNCYKWHRLFTKMKLTLERANSFILSKTIL